MEKEAAIIILLLAVLTILLLVGMSSKKARFAFPAGIRDVRDPFVHRNPFSLKNPNLPHWMARNAKFQYNNPNPTGELRYYECLAGNCKGDTHDFDCLERCRIKTFLNEAEGGMISPIKDSICSDQGRGSPAYYDCLVNAYMQRPY